MENSGTLWCDSRLLSGIRPPNEQFLKQDCSRCFISLWFSFKTAVCERKTESKPKNQQFVVMADSFVHTGTSFAVGLRTAGMAARLGFLIRKRSSAEHLQSCSCLCFTGLCEQEKLKGRKMFLLRGGQRKHSWGGRELNFLFCHWSKLRWWAEMLVRQLHVYWSAAESSPPEVFPVFELNWSILTEQLLDLPRPLKKPCRRKVQRSHRPADGFLSLKG